MSRDGREPEYTSQGPQELSCEREKSSYSVFEHR